MTNKVVSGTAAPWNFQGDKMPLDSRSVHISCKMGFTQELQVLK